MRQKTQGLSGNALTLLAAAAMLADHLGWQLLADDTPAAALVHFIGRLALPIFAFFIAEGYLHTHSLPRYAARLAVGAVLAAVPFSLFLSGTLFGAPFSVLYTLLLGLLAIAAADRLRGGVLFGVLLALLALALPGDWGPFAPLLCLAAWQARKQHKIPVAAYITVGLALCAGNFADALLAGRAIGPALCLALPQLGVALAPAFLALYNGTRGKGGAVAGWAFYLFYPLHLLLIDLLL